MPSPELQLVLDAMVAARQAQPADAPPVAELRAGYEAVALALPAAPDVAFEAVDAGGVPAEWLTAPGCDPGRTLLYLHGGGYATGSTATHRDLASRLARAAGARGLSVDYRLAPEHPFPAARDDALAAYRWLLDQGVAPGSVAVAGDSAGGGLAAALVLEARDTGVALPAAVLLLSPWTDLTTSREVLVERAAKDPLIGPDHLLGHADWYLGGGAADRAGTSPGLAALAGLPPLLVQVGTSECLYDDAVLIVERASAAGVAAELDPYEGCFHVFQQLVPHAPETIAAVERAGRFLRDHLS